MQLTSLRTATLRRDDETQVRAIEVNAGKSTQPCMI